jgi:hypothetical protein
MRLSFENSFARSGPRAIVFSLFAAAFLFGGQPAIQRALAQAGSIGEVTFQIG